MRCGELHDWLRELSAYPTPRKIASYLQDELTLIEGGDAGDPGEAGGSPRRRHLLRCRRCRDRLRSALKYWSLLGLFCRDVTPGPGLELRVAERIRAEAEEPLTATPTKPRAALRAEAAAIVPEEAALYQDAGGAAPVVGWLVALARPVRGLALAPGENVIGSDPSADFVLDDPSVGARHASIVCAVSAAGASYFVLDHRSETGTFLNGGEERLTWARLEDNDVLRLGDVRLKFKTLVGVRAG